MDAVVETWPESQISILQYLHSAMAVIVALILIMLFWMMMLTMMTRSAPTGEPRKLEN